MTIGSVRKPWYASGLRFECTQCGNCCSGPPGYVWTTKEEVRRIAAFFGREDGRLSDGQLRRVGLRFSLTEKKNGDCVFLRSEGDRRVCSIYPVRPLQCRTWPFWTTNLRSARAWAEAGATCPGMNNGPNHELVQIETRRNQKSW